MRSTAGSQIEVLATTNAAGTTAINLTGNEFAQTIAGQCRRQHPQRRRRRRHDDRLWRQRHLLCRQCRRQVGRGGWRRRRQGARLGELCAWHSAGAQIELLATTNAAGTAAINLTGNEFAQTIQGNAGANYINGGGGADTLTGFGGNDTYIVDNAGDRVIEAAGGGSDRVFASVSYALSAGSQVELLGTTDAAATTAINLTGNEFAQTIQGNAGANVINGGGGADTMTGYGGNDSFVFNAALGAGNVDRITDFNKSQDNIHLDHAVFAGLTLGELSSDAFFAGAAAHDSSDHIIYNSSTGALSFDSDGIGGTAQTQFATLSPGLSITASSFFVT